MASTELLITDPVIMELAQDGGSPEIKYKIFYKIDQVPAGVIQSDFNDNKIEQDDRIFTINLEELLGKGGFGITYAATKSDVNQQEKICIKRNKKKNTYNSIVNEWKILKDLGHHDYIVRYLFTCTTSTGYCFLGLEYFNGYDLLKWINDEESNGSDHFPNKYTKLIAVQAVGAIAYLNSRGIYHCDIKPANILFHKQKDQIRIIDFGLAKQRFDSTATDHLSCNHGTYAYMPPEVLISRRLAASSDIYGLGATLLHLSTLKLPWSDFLSLPNDRDDIEGAFGDICECHTYLIIQCKLLEKEKHPNISEGLKMVIVDMLHKEETQRITCEDIHSRLSVLDLDLERKQDMAGKDANGGDAIPLTIYDTTHSSFGTQT